MRLSTADHRLHHGNLLSKWEPRRLRCTRCLDSIDLTKTENFSYLCRQRRRLLRRSLGRNWNHNNALTTELSSVFNLLKMLLNLKSSIKVLGNWTMKFFDWRWKLILFAAAWLAKLQLKSLIDFGLGWIFLLIGAINRSKSSLQLVRKLTEISFYKKIDVHLIRNILRKIRIKLPDSISRKLRIWKLMSLCFRTVWIPSSAASVATSAAPRTPETPFWTPTRSRHESDGSAGDNS